MTSPSATKQAFLDAIAKYRGGAGSFRLLDPHGRYGIIAGLDNEGTLRFFIQADKASPIRGTELIAKMMAHYGNRVKAVRGVWGSGTNLDKVNQLTRAGMKLEDAVSHAWTATRVAKYGFTQAKVVEQVGSPGAYLGIVVEFARAAAPGAARASGAGGALGAGVLPGAALQLKDEVRRAGE